MAMTKDEVSTWCLDLARQINNHPVLRSTFVKTYDKQWVGLTQTQVKLLREGVEKESIKTGDSIDWVFYTHINEALKEKNS